MGTSTWASGNNRVNGEVGVLQKAVNSAKNPNFTKTVIFENSALSIESPIDCEKSEKNEKALTSEIKVRKCRDQIYMLV